MGLDVRNLTVINNTEGNDAAFAIVSACMDVLQNRPIEDSKGVLEVDPMLGDVARVFGFVPFEVHLSIYKSYRHFAAPSNPSSCGSPDRHPVYPARPRLVAGC